MHRAHHIGPLNECVGVANVVKLENVEEDDTQRKRCQIEYFFHSVSAVKQRRRSWKKVHYSV